jgi:RNA polymerase sigma-B factor
VIVDESDPTVTIVGVLGEMDLATASSLQDQLSRLIATGPQRLVIDVTHVSFLGAAALSVFIDARRASARRGTTLQLRVPNRPAMLRPLHLTGLDRLIEIVPPPTDTAGSPHRPPGTHAEAPRPRPAQRTDTDAATPAQCPVETPPDAYAHLIPLQRRYAELAADDPQRHRLRSQLVGGYLPVAEHLARRFAGRGEPRADLIQVASIGLINAIDRFDPARGSHFLSFAVPTITGEIRRYFRDHGWGTRVPRRIKDLTLAIRNVRAELSHQLGRAPRSSEIAERLDVPTSKVIEALHAVEAYRSASLDEVLRCEETTATPHMVLGELDPHLWLVEHRETLRPLLAHLTPRQRTILGLRFFHQLTQHEIATQIGVSQMHVSRLLRQTLDFLHQHITDSPEPTRPPQATNARPRTTTPRVTPRAVASTNAGAVRPSGPGSEDRCSVPDLATAP